MNNFAKETGINNPEIAANKFRVLMLMMK